MRAGVPRDAEAIAGWCEAAFRAGGAAFDPILAAAWDLLPHGMAIADPGWRLLFANRSFLALLGADPAREDAPGLAALVAPHLGIVDDGATSRALVERMATGEECPLEVEARLLLLASRALPNGFHLVTLEDVTDQRRLHLRAAQLARQDPLTALPNRLVLREQLTQGLAELAGADGAAGSLAVLSLDLDRFKLVNDTLGHPAGDRLLERVADRLRFAVGPNDTVARFGGDEFVILQRTGEQPAAALALAARVVDLLGRAYLLEDQIVNTGASLGFAIGPHDGANPDALLKSADLALYRAKEGGRGRFCRFEPEMRARVELRRALEFDLRKALGLREFELFYQPLFNFDRDRVEGCEALLRWRHPDRGLVSPADFIPIVEELGLIIPIGEWVLRAACAEAATWPEHMSVAVNLSAVQFSSPRLVSAVMQALAASGLAPSRLELEITESVLLDEKSGALTVLHELRRMGVRISMDDFGTGYSSLSYLRSFPFDKIKIDQSFVRGMGNSKDCVAIVRAIAGLANALGIMTTAEGVETPEQKERVRLEGCTSIQGYLISRPLPPAEIRPLFENAVLARAEAARVA